MKRKLENLKITSFVTDLESGRSNTIVGGESLGCPMEPEKLPDTWYCFSVNRCRSVNNYTCIDPYKLG